MDTWFIVSLVTDDLELINQGVIVPTNWVVVPKRKSDNLRVRYMELAGQLGDEDKLLIDVLAQRRQPAPEGWPLHLFALKGKAKSWHEAERTLEVLMGGDITIHNSNNNDKIESLLDTTGHGRCYYSYI